MGAAREAASPAERRAWVRLVAEARALAERPRRDARDLGRAARACLTAVVPAGTWERSNPLFRLLDVARHVAEVGAEARAAHAAQLAAALDAARTLWPEGEAEAAAETARRPLGGACSAPTEPRVRYPTPARYPPPRPAPALRFRADIDG